MIRNYLLRFLFQFWRRFFPFLYIVGILPVAIYALFICSALVYILVLFVEFYSRVSQKIPQKYFDVVIEHFCAAHFKVYYYLCAFTGLILIRNLYVYIL